MKTDSTDKPKSKEDAFVKTERRDKGYSRAAQLLIILGKEHAAKVLSHLTEEEALAVTKEIANMDTVSGDEAKKVLKDFGYLIKAKDLVARGGVAKAKEMLNLAFGPEKAEGFYNKLLEKTVPHPFAFLNDLKADALLALLRDESAPVISLILSHIDPLLAAKVLTALPIDLKKQIARRISGMKTIPPEVIRKTEEVLRNKIKVAGEIVSQDIDGKAALVGILKNLGMSQGKKIIEELSEANPELASEIESKLFSLDIVHRISDRDLQKLLRETPDMEIAKLIKAKDRKFTERILSNVSGRRSELIKFDNQGIGKILKTEIEKTENEFLALVKDKLEKGEITILDDDGQYV
jgi:flagellar motor switch protein FliG